jgi:hypothetical protein
MGWVSATQYEPEFWGKLPVKPAAVDPIDPIDPPFRAAPVAEPKVEEPKVEEPKVEDPKVEPKVVKDDAAPAVKRVAKKTTPKAKPKTESDDDDKE